MFRVLVVLIVSGLCLTACAVKSPSNSNRLLVQNINLVSMPGSPPQLVSVLIEDEEIASVETAIATDEYTEVIDGEGRFATAGLWNSHVHFTDSKLLSSPQSIIDQMLLQYGFTSVVDTGSSLQGTRNLIDAIEAGELKGPQIFMANGSFVGAGGSPAYLADSLPELTEPEDVHRQVDAVLDQGADGIKIFSGSFVSPTETAHMREDVIAAVTEAAHARGAIVFSHPQSRIGLERAVANNVDVIVHTAPAAGELDAVLIDMMLSKEVALVPTLKLWRWELGRAGVPEVGIQVSHDTAVGQARSYFDAGGEILFGTDVGYMDDYSPRDEYAALAEAGLDFDAMLASLTTSPSQRIAGEGGKVEPGAPGDIVIYIGNPRENPSAFADVAITIRNGEVVYNVERENERSAK